MLHPEQNPFNSAVASFFSFLREKNRRRAARRCPTAAWPRLRCTEIDLITEVRKVYKVVHIRPVGEGGQRAAQASTSQSHKKQMILFTFYSTNTENSEIKSFFPTDGSTAAFLNWRVAVQRRGPVLI